MAAVRAQIQAERRAERSSTTARRHGGFTTNHAGNFISLGDNFRDQIPYPGFATHTEAFQDPKCCEQDLLLEKPLAPKSGRLEDSFPVGSLRPASGKADKSFGSLFCNLEKNSDPNVFEQRESFLFEGEPAIEFTKEEVAQLSLPLKNTLIGKCSHGRPKLADIRVAFGMLGFKGRLRIGLIDKKHILLRFSDQDDCLRVWLRHVWYIKKCPLRILKWMPDFCTDFESPIVPVWIHFPQLPLHYFNPSALLSIAKVAGLPLKLDIPTTQLSLPSLARVCVQLNLNENLPKRVWIKNDNFGGFWQSIVYENLRDYCNICKRLDHNGKNCRTNMSTKKPRVQYIPKSSQPGRVSTNAVCPVTSTYASAAAVIAGTRKVTATPISNRFEELQIDVVDDLEPAVSGTKDDGNLGTSKLNSSKGNVEPNHPVISTTGKAAIAGVSPVHSVCIRYENRSDFCIQCRKIGHSVKNCRSKKDLIKHINECYKVTGIANSVNPLDNERNFSDNSRELDPTRQLVSEKVTLQPFVSTAHKVRGKAVLLEGVSEGKWCNAQHATAEKIEGFDEYFDGLRGEFQINDILKVKPLHLPQHTTDSARDDSCDLSESEYSLTGIYSDSEWLISARNTEMNARLSPRAKANSSLSPRSDGYLDTSDCGLDELTFQFAADSYRLHKAINQRFPKWEPVKKRNRGRPKKGEHMIPAPTAINKSVTRGFKMISSDD